MNRCPITYEECGDEKYSAKGLRQLSPNLKSLNDFPYTAKEQIEESAARTSKMSIQGVQPKLSAGLNVKNGSFEICDIGGRYIIKPQNERYAQLPQNEDLTMKLAELMDIETPFHGMVYSKDNSLSYFIRRFDRKNNGDKIPVEDFAQLTGGSRQTKYGAIMEKLCGLIDKYCTFPALEKLKLFKLVLFNFLTGNEDMHLKNYSLISRQNKVELSPSYDLINTTIVIRAAEEEIALPIAGRKSGLRRADLFEYFAVERLALNEISIRKIEQQIAKALPAWKKLIRVSFLTEEFKLKYAELLDERVGRVLKI